MKRAARLQDGTASQILAIKSLYSSSLAFLQEQSIQGWVKQVFGKLDSRLRLFHGGSRTRQLITSYTPGKTAVRTGNRELWTIIAISSRICSEHRGPPPAQDPDGPQAPPDRADVTYRDCTTSGSSPSPCCNAMSYICISTSICSTAA